MIPKSNDYKLVKDDKVIAEGNKSAMVTLSKKLGGYKAGYILWLSPGTKVGDTLSNVTPNQ